MQRGIERVVDVSEIVIKAMYRSLRHCIAGEEYAATRQQLNRYSRCGWQRVFTKTTDCAANIVSIRNGRLSRNEKNNAIGGVHVVNAEWGV